MSCFFDFRVAYPGIAENQFIEAPTPCADCSAEGEKVRRDPIKDFAVLLPTHRMIHTDFGT